MVDPNRLRLDLGTPALDILSGGNPCRPEASRPNARSAASDT